MSIIKLNNVHKRFIKAREHIDVLLGIDLSVEKGEFLALMGPSGSGKTTLLNIIGGIDDATGGTVSVVSTEISSLGKRAIASWRALHIGFIFQFYNLLPVLSARKNVELPLLLTNLSTKRRREHAVTALDVVGLSERADYKSSELSGGQQQRVAIARAIVADPSILLCDEPTGDLDRKSADEILEILATLNRNHGKTIVMVTHDPKAARYAQRTTHLDKGVLAKAVV